MTIHIGRPIVESLVQHARRDYPEECCGVLLGRQRSTHVYVSRLIQADNISEEDRSKTYQVDWKALFAAIRAARRGGDKLIGFYHSHPDGSTAPSRRDRELAWLDHSYVIVPAPGGRGGEVTSWRVPREDAPFEPERMLVT